MAAMIEITGIFCREFWRSPDGESAGLTVEVEGRDTAVFGGFAPNELTADLEYRFTGTWGKERNGRGKPFNATAVTLVQPHTRQGIVTYLVRAGQGLRFGPVRAATVYDEWGQEAVRMCREQPGAVVELMQRKRLKWDMASAVNLQARLGDDAAMEATTLEVLDLLTGRGFPRGLVREAVKEWGARAAQTIRRDPYKLMRFRGCGFKRTDAMWLELKLPAARLKRQAMCAWHSIASDSDGHTWFPVQMVWAALRAGIGGTEVRKEKALRLARLGKLLAEVRTDGPRGPISEAGETRWVAERRNAENEREIAETIAGAMREGCRWPTI